MPVVCGREQVNEHRTYEHYHTVQEQHLIGCKQVLDERKADVCFRRDQQEIMTPSADSFNSPKSSESQQEVYLLENCSIVSQRQECRIKNYLSAEKMSNTSSASLKSFESTYQYCSGEYEHKELESKIRTEVPDHTNQLKFCNLKVENNLNVEDDAAWFEFTDTDNSDFRKDITKIRGNVRVSEHKSCAVYGSIDKSVHQITLVNSNYDDCPLSGTSNPVHDPKLLMSNEIKGLISMPAVVPPKDVISSGINKLGKMSLRIRFSEIEKPLLQNYREAPLGDTSRHTIENTDDSGFSREVSKDWSLLHCLCCF